MGLFRRRPRDPRRVKTESHRAWWEAVPSSGFPNVSGKIEWDTFQSGDSEIDLLARVPGVPDGDEVEVVWGDAVVTTMTVRKGLISRDLETKDGDDVPRLADQHVELRHQGVVIGRGHLTPERRNGRGRPAP